MEIVNSLEEKCIGFKSLSENIDTTTSTGKLVFHIFGAFSEFEGNLIRERQEQVLMPQGPEEEKAVGQKRYQKIK